MDESDTPELRPGAEAEIDTTSEGEVPFGAETDSEPWVRPLHDSERAARPDDVIFDDEPISPELPNHLEHALNSLLGDQAAEYREADEEKQREMVEEAILLMGNPYDESITATEIRDGLNLIIARSEEQLLRQGMSVENATDLLARINAVSTTWRRLGANKLVRGLRLGAVSATGVLAGTAFLTSSVIKGAERAVGLGAGGVVGASLGALGYQQMYQRNLENSWQRGQPVFKTVINRAVRPFKFLKYQRDTDDLEKGYEAVPVARGGKISKVFQHIKRGIVSHKSAYERHRAEEEAHVHLTADQVEYELTKDQVLKRLAQGRLALTRQDRRVKKWSEHEINMRNYNLEAYEALVHRAVRECTPEEIQQALNKTDRQAAVHLAVSVLAGVAGAAAGFFGVRAWQEAHLPIEAASVPEVAPLPEAAPESLVEPSFNAPEITEPAVVVPAPEEVVTPTAPEMSAWDISYKEHLTRSLALEQAGAGHFEGDEFVITADHQIDGQGNGWIEVDGQRLTVEHGQTDISSLEPADFDYLTERTERLQEGMTGENLARAYGFEGDQAVIAQAEQIKDALAEHLVEQELFGTSELPAGIHEQLAGAGYDFDTTDVQSTGDVRREIHQAMAKWFEKQPVKTAAPVIPQAPVAAPAPIEHWTPSAARAVAPRVEQAVFARPEVSIPTEPVATPKLTIGHAPAAVAPAPEYSGWSFPSTEPESVETVVELPVDVRPVEQLAGPVEVLPARPEPIPSVGVADSAEPVVKAELPPTEVEAPVAATVEPSTPTVAPRPDENMVLDDFFTN